MCGFVSVISSEVQSYKKIFKGLKKINTHRGPDSVQSLNNNNYLILFRRLSIIDVSTNADQPFISLDKKIKIIFNGEIYNYLEIKNILIKKKHKFFTTSDTEVIMRSYEEWGIKFATQLRGMFSIVIFDDRKNKVFFIRDPIGQKPLFYMKINKDLIVSSEIKDILYILNKKKISFYENKQTVFKYLLRGWTNDTDQTFFKHINEFPSGTITSYNYKKLSQSKRYWYLKFNNRKYNKKQFLKKFYENINIHLRSDVPIALTLSSGMDSSSIVKISHKLKKNNKIAAFSLKLKNSEDESNGVKYFLKNNKIKHEFVEVEKYYNKNLLFEIIKNQDEPLASASHINQFILRKEIKKKGYKVLIVGEGGDEVLGGYARMIIPYLIENYIKKKKIIPKKIYKNISKFFQINKNEIDHKILKFKLKNRIKDDFEQKQIISFLKSKPKLLKKNLRFYNPYFSTTKDLFKKTLNEHIFKRDMPYIIRAEDRISMCHSIENRNPFIDHKFIEYIFSHNPFFFMKNGIPKFMLRNSMKNKLTKKFIFGKKIGRPINLEKFITTKYSKKNFINLIKKYKIEKFNEKKILDGFKLDIKANNKNNFEFYFRILNYLYWKKIFF